MKVVLTDDNGVEINTRSYDLGTSLKKLGDMERNIEKLRPQVLGDITKDLLSSAQSATKKRVSGLSTGTDKDHQWFIRV